jgi:hypothetical protein
MIGASALLFLLVTGTAVWLGRGDAQFLYSAEKRGLGDAKLLRRGEAVEDIAFEG